MTNQGVALANTLSRRKTTYIKSLVIACLSWMAFNAQATTVTPLRGVDLLFVNGAETDSNSDAHKVPSGPVQLVVRMNKKVGRGSNERPYVSSPYIVTLQASGDEIKINHPVARSWIEAEAVFRKQAPEWRLLQDGNHLDYTVVKLEGDAGLFPYSDMAALLETYNQQNAPEFALQAVAEVPTSVVKVAAVPVVTTTEPVALTSTALKPEVNTTNAQLESENISQLKAWYQKASTEERKAFRRWMIDQE